MKEESKKYEPVMVERPSEDELAQTASLDNKQELLKMQQKLLEAQLENVKQQMNLTLT